MAMASFIRRCISVTAAFASPAMIAWTAQPATLCNSPVGLIWGSLRNRERSSSFDAVSASSTVITTVTTAPGGNSGGLICSLTNKFSFC